MKIGILTFHCAHNYGAVLQAYATQETLKSMGHTVEIIDYRPKAITKTYDYSLKFERPYRNPILRTLSYIKMMFLWSTTLIGKIIRRRGFNNFIKTKLQLSQHTYLIPFDENSDYDCYIIGSDQVWNPSITKGMDSLYFGDFKTKKGVIKFTYAPSMPIYSLNNETKQELARNLTNFSAISVRETQLKNYLIENFQINSQVVIDPTLLVDNNLWHKIAKKPKIKRKYVLLFTFILHKQTREIAENIAKEIHGVVVELCGGAKIIDGTYSYSTASPEEYLGLFQNASFVVTGSFHGTAFSISYQKPFYSVARGDDKDSRQESLLRSLGLSDRLIDKDSRPNYQEIDYINVNKKWKELQNQSLIYLESALKNEF